MTRGELIEALGGKVAPDDDASEEVIVRDSESWDEFEVKDTGYESGNFMLHVEEKKE